MHQGPVILAVVPAEARQPTAALRRAAAVARHSRAPLHLCCFVSDELDGAPSSSASDPLTREIRDDLVAEQLEHVAAIAQSPDLQGCELRYEVQWAGSVHERLIQHALQLGASCVVKDIHAESVLRRALFTPTDWKLIRLLPCDLMLIRDSSPPMPRKIMAAVDVLAEPTEIADGLNVRIVAAARRLGALADADADAGFDLVSVAPWRRYATRGAASGDLLDALISEHQQAFRRFAEAQHIPPDHRHRLLGVPAEAIATMAEELGVDLTVVGNVYRNTIERLFLGSTAETLLQKLKSDLLVVKPADFVNTAAPYVAARSAAAPGAQAAAVQNPSAAQPMRNSISIQPGSSLTGRQRKPS